MAQQSVARGWEQLFREQVDVSKDLNIVSTQLIRQYCGEVRLATKFDTRTQLPAIFRRHNYFLLPLQNGGNFAIVRGDGFHNIEPVSRVQAYTSMLDTDLKSLEQFGMGESKYIEYAGNTGLLEHFLGVKGLRTSARGRMRTKPFTFKFNGIELQASSVQVEVDASYESGQAKVVVIIEAKVTGLLTNFNIRQLYYPLRLYTAYVQERAFRTVFFIYNPVNKTYNFWEYQFEDIDEFLSISLKQCASYHIQKAVKTLTAQEVIKQKIKHAPVVKSLDIPQADDFRKVAALPFMIREGIDTSLGVATALEFNRRQSSYYRQAAQFLGLVALEKYHYVLTELGKEYVETRADSGNVMLSALILKMPIVKVIMQQLFKSDEQQLSKEEIIRIIEEHSKCNRTTSKRRASTIIAWLRWSSAYVGIFKVERNIVSLP